MRDIYSEIVESLKSKRFLVLATIIGHRGSVPRGTGTKLLILKDGSSFGTIGGGILEKSVIEESKKVFSSRSPIRYSRILKGTDVTDSDMLCGGDVDIFLEPISPDNPDHLHIFEMISSMFRRGGAGLLATIVDIDRWREPALIYKLFIHSRGERSGALAGLREIEEDISKSVNQLMADRRPRTLAYRDNEGNEVQVFIEPMISSPVLYLFGGGHVSSQVAPLANRVGFKVVVIDDRPEFADPDRFPEVAEIHNYPYDDVTARLPVNESSYLVILTHGHGHDKTVLAQSLRTPAGYIGMIGSRRKISIVYNKLMEEGFTREDLERVHSPIGVDIGAETPEEIAVSIVAELIKVRAGA